MAITTPASGSEPAWRGNVRRVLLSPAGSRPRPLLAAGVVAGLVLSSALLVQQWALGRSPFGEQGNWSDVWVALVHCLLAGYLPAAMAATVAGADRVQREMGSSGNRDAAVISARWFLLAAVVGAALGFLGPWLTEPEVGGPGVFWMPHNLVPETYWHRILGLWIMTWFALYAVTLLAVSRQLADVGAHARTADPFDRAPFLPLVRQSLLQALTVAVAVALLGLLGLDQGLSLMLVLFGGGGVLLMVAAGLLPLLGVRERRARARSAELKWCDKAIRSARMTLREHGVEGTPGRLADLLAHRQLTRATSTWPFDLSAVQRFMLYLLIPLFSWVASAVVAEAVQRALGGR